MDALIYCDKLHHGWTEGDRCAICQQDAENAARRAAENAPRIKSLRAARERLIAGWHKPWPGMEFGKAHVGQMIDAALADLA